MAATTADLVWYASYGSNCSRARFLTYLRGGRPDGSDREQTGARDANDPLDDRPVEFASGIYFSGHSRRWGGAPAFLEHRPADGRGALGRRYLITREQFADVMAQESGREFDSVVLPDLAGLTAGSLVAVGDGFYDALVGLGMFGGVPCVSFTSPEAPESRQAAPPSAAYLGTIVRGLAESHDLEHHEIATRLVAAPGVAPEWDVESVTALIRSV